MSFRLWLLRLRSEAQTAWRSPRVRRLRTRHPRFFRFVEGRLSPEARYGLHLTLGAAAAFGLILLFAEIAEEIGQEDELVRFDALAARLIRSVRAPWLDRAMLLVTSAGSWQAVVLGLALSAGPLALLRRWRSLAALALSVAGGQVFVELAKLWFGRERPPLVGAVIEEAGMSFPSGHGFVAVSFYGFAAYLLFREARGGRARAFIAAAALAFILMLGFSRVYLGVHWPSDVLGSLASGGAWVAVLITASETRRRSGPRAPAVPRGRRRLAAMAGVALLALWGWLVVEVSRRTPPLPPPGAGLSTPPPAPSAGRPGRR